MVSILGVLATVLGLAGAVAMGLQARTLLHAGTACEVSLAFLSITACGYAVWLAYGAALNDPALIVVDAAGLGAAATALGVALRLHHRKPCPHGVTHMPAVAGVG